jgi:hypothetical protein
MKMSVDMVHYILTNETCILKWLKSFD